MNGIISGTGNLIKDTNSSTLTLTSVSSSYSGSTTISAGTLSLTGVLGSGTGTAITNYATFTESSAGVIAGTSSVRTRAGTTTLAGTNTYSGTTSINGGTLSLTGTIGSGTGTAITSGGHVQ